MTYNPPAGWYPDPASDGSERYWNGSSWDSATRAAAPQQTGSDQRYYQQGGYQQQYGQQQWGEQPGYQPTSVMPQGVAAPPTAHQPTTSSPGRGWLVAVVGVICLLVGGGAGWAIGHDSNSSKSDNNAGGPAPATSTGSGGSSQPTGQATSAAPSTSASTPSGPTFTVNGTMTLVDPDASYTQGSECNGSLGYNDITKGAQVTVTDPSGSTLATGELQQGVAQDANTCLFHFTVSQVPEQSAYQIEVSNRGKVSESLDDMKRGVALELGDR